jgi:hypothetical protein
MILHVKEPGVNPAKATPLGAGPRRTAPEVEALCVSPVAARSGSLPQGRSYASMPGRIIAVPAQSEVGHMRAMKISAPAASPARSGCVRTAAPRPGPASRPGKDSCCPHSAERSGAPGPYCFAPRWAGPTSGTASWWTGCRRTKDTAVSAVRCDMCLQAHSGRWRRSQTEC